MSSAPDIVEPCVVTPTFCDGIATVDIDRNGNARLSFFVEQAEVYGDRRTIQVLNERLIIPQSALPAMIGMILDAMSPESREFARYWQAGVVAHA